MSKAKPIQLGDILKAMGISAAGILSAAIAYGALTNNVTNLEKDVQQNTVDIREVEQWQDDWESNGELPSDIRQDKNDEFIFKEIERLERELNALKVIVEADR